MSSPAADFSATARSTQDRPQSRTRREFWPQAVIAFGLGLTATWVMLLGYGFLELIKLAI